MPLTISHPAAVLPLRRLAVPTSALVIGSVAPDLAYYLPVPVDPVASHSLSGVLGVNLLVGLAGYLVWHLVLVPPLRWIAPAELQGRVAATGKGPALASAADLARVALGLALGALTHVALDAFTHEHTVGPRVLPWLARSFLGYPVYLWLQVGLSVAGLAVLGVVLLRWWARTPSTEHSDAVPASVRWGIAAALTGWATFTTLQLAVARVMAPGVADREQLVVESIIEFLSTFAQGVIAAAVVWHIANAVGAALERVGTRP